jgi:hypothetical protein
MEAAESRRGIASRTRAFTAATTRERINVFFRKECASAFISHLG